MVDPNFKLILGLSFGWSFYFSTGSRKKRKIKAGEKALHELGFSELRLRWRKEGAKLELPESQIAMAVEKRDDILAALGGDFKEITLDLQGRDTNG